MTDVFQARRVAKPKPLLSESGENAVGAATVTTSAGAVLACSACCVLPLALPAVALGGAAGLVAWMEAVHGWITGLSIVFLLAGWAFVAMQAHRTGKRAARATISMLLAATGLTLVALSWPLLEPTLVALFQV